MGKKICIVFFLILANGLVFAVENPKTLQSVTAEVFVSAKGSISGDIGSVPVTIKALSFSETDSQKIIQLKQYLQINEKTVPPKIESDEWGNRYAVFSFSETGEFEYFIEATIETDYSGKEFEEYDLSTPITEFEEFNVATEEVESDHESIKTLAFNEFDSNSLLETASAVTDWVFNYLEYDSSFLGGEKSAVKTFEERKGVCGDFANLAGAILRAKKIPVRFAAGIVSSGQDWNNHAWLQTYNPNYGWIDLDPTYAEAGLVDGTHIVLGYFPDQSNVRDTVTASMDTNIFLGQKYTRVNVIETKEFSGIVEITTNPLEVETLQWFDLNFAVKNLSNNYAFTPITVNLPEGFVIEEKTKVILLEPNQEKTISTKVYPNIALEENQILTGKYYIEAFAPKKEETIKIVKSAENSIPAKLELIEITPLVQGRMLTISVAIANLGTESGEVEITIKSPSYEFTKKDSVGGLEQKRFTATIPDHKKETFQIIVKGTGMDFQKEIVLKQETQKTTSEINLERDFPIVVAIIISVIGCLIVLKSLLKQ
ncbi:MAG: transglutaminase domain-containing protein [Candidatus Diapherotrites archaeon]|nr:transglutaminase domain-containing protein [Candidatus Diapherotrites archaeon]